MYGAEGIEGSAASDVPLCHPLFLLRHIGAAAEGKRGATQGYSVPRMNVNLIQPRKCLLPRVSRAASLSFSSTSTVVCRAGQYTSGLLGSAVAVDHYLELFATYSFRTGHGQLAGRSS